MEVIFEFDERWGIRGVYVPPGSGWLSLVAQYFDAFDFDAGDHFVVRAGVDFGVNEACEFR